MFVIIPLNTTAEVPVKFQNGMVIYTAEVSIKFQSDNGNLYYQSNGFEFLQLDVLLAGEMGPEQSFVQYSNHNLTH